MFTDRQKQIILELLSSFQVKPGGSGLLQEVEQIIALLNTKPEKESDKTPEVISEVVS